VPRLLEPVTCGWGALPQPEPIGAGDCPGPDRTDHRNRHNRGEDLGALDHDEDHGQRGENQDEINEEKEREIFPEKQAEDPRERRVGC